MGAFSLAVLMAGGKHRQALRAMLAGAMGLVLFVAVVGIIAAANFNLFFTLFHRAFFEGESWLFSRTDSLIQLYPLPFWVDATRRWLCISLGASALLMVSSLALLRWLSPKLPAGPEAEKGQLSERST